jgi:hypothetical protein
LIFYYHCTHTVAGQQAHRVWTSDQRNGHLRID